MGKALCQEVWIKVACGFNLKAYTKLFSKCNLGNIIILFHVESWFFPVFLVYKFYALAWVPLKTMQKS